MRVLIISLPRTGSTSLLYSISKSKNLQPIYEPFDGSNRVVYDSNMQNIVLKTIVCTQFPNDIDDYYKWIIEFSNEFDETILLSRKDLKACAESHSYWVSNKKNGFTSTQKYLWKESPMDELCYSNVIYWNSVLLDVSNELNIPITYYEDIYDLNSKHRLRQGDRSQIESKII